MLSNDTEMKIIKLFLGIANGDKKIDNIKRTIVEKFPINPEELFFKIDSTLKGSITPDDLISYLSQFQVQCSQNEAKLIIFFYDANQDGQLDFFEFLNLLISDSDYLFKKICKKRFAKKNTLPPTTQEIEKSIVDLLINEIDFSRYMFELISDVKSNDDFSLQDLFYVIKSYSFITFESIKAFFDRNGINYSPSDIKSIFNRIDSNRDGKICFNELKSLFNISNESTFSQSGRNNNFSNIDDGDYQYECSHLSRSNSPICHTSNIVRMPILNPPIKDGRNCQYKNYVRHVRETSLSRSKSRSLSRSSDYQSPGEKSGDENEKMYHSYSAYNNSNVMQKKEEVSYCNTEQQLPVRINRRMIIKTGAEKKMRKNSNNNIRTYNSNFNISGEDITYEMNNQ